MAIKYNAMITVLFFGLLSWGSAHAEKREVSLPDLGEAPNFVVSTVDGVKISLEDSVRGNNKVVMVFWATWCRYCRDLLPRLNDLHQQVNAKASGDKSPQVTFIAFNIWEDGNAQHYMTSKQLTLPLSLRAEDIAKKYQVRGTPAVFVVGQDRRILYRRQAGHSVDQTLAAVKDVLVP